MKISLFNYDTLYMYLPFKTVARKLRKDIGICNLALVHPFLFLIATFFFKIKMFLKEFDKLLILSPLFCEYDMIDRAVSPKPDVLYL